MLLSLALAVALLLPHAATHAAPCAYTSDPSLSPPILLDRGTGYSLQYKADETAQTLTVVLGALAANTGFLGFGLPEQTSGAMLGADIVTVTFYGAGEAPSVTDRYVAWVPFPFSPYESTYEVKTGQWLPTSPGPFPSQDCSNNGTDDWSATWAVQTATCKQVELVRRFSTGDANDRDITQGVMLYLWAVGPVNNTISYHGTTRGTGSAPFRQGGTPPPTPPCSDCLTYNVTIGPSYSVPNSSTTYACQTFLLDSAQLPGLNSNQTWTIVGFAPILEAANARESAVASPDHPLTRSAPRSVRAPHRHWGMLRDRLGLVLARAASDPRLLAEPGRRLHAGLRRVAVRVGHRREPVQVRRASRHSPLAPLLETHFAGIACTHAASRPASAWNSATAPTPRWSRASRCRRTTPTWRGSTPSWTRPASKSRCSRASLKWPRGSS